MMAVSVGLALVSRLTTVAAVTALVGSRIYPLKVPQGATMPCIRYANISTIERVNAMGNDPGPVSQRMQLDCYGTTYASARAVFEATQAALQRYRGTEAGIEVMASFIDDEQDSFEEDATYGGLYRSRLDVVIWVRE